MVLHQFEVGDAVLQLGKQVLLGGPAPPRQAAGFPPPCATCHTTTTWTGGTFALGDLRVTPLNPAAAVA